MSESTTQAKIFRHVGSRPDCRLFRNNQGMGWVGQLVNRCDNGTVVLRNARPLHAGLHTGSADLIGWHSRIVTPADVGRLFAVFLSLEVKDGRGGIRPEQFLWQKAVCDAGGIAAIVRSTEDCDAAIPKFFTP